MKMKQHILAALREEYEAWEAALAGLSEEQITAPLPSSAWSIKDNVAHLMAWQLRSSARVEAALLNREPEFPKWPAALMEATPDPTDQINAWIYTTYRDQPWSTVYQDWKKGFQRFLELSEKVSEKDLLDGDRYPWLKGYSLSAYLIASYDHHQEHLEQLPGTPTK